ncbi:hypothetical protein ACWEN3_45625 [Streptomyces sp. NPDC004561]
MTADTTANGRATEKTPDDARARGASRAAAEASDAAHAGPLLGRLAVLRDRAAALVEHRSADDPTAGDPLRGLYLSEEAVRHLLRPVEPAPAYRTARGGTGER